MLNQLIEFVELLNEILWGPAALIVLALIGIYLTYGTRFVHIKKFFSILKTTIAQTRGKDETNSDAEGVLSSSQSLFTALASTIGMGSIVGVASALVSGGPGAIIWMWIAAVIGMIIKYAEIILIIRYRKKTEDGEFVGGPALYVKDGLNRPKLGKWITFIMVLVCLASTMVQSNVIVQNVENLLPLPINNYLVSAIVVILTGAVILGGVKRLGAVTEKLVPLMAGSYLLVGLFVILVNAKNIIPSFQVMFQGFLSPVAIGGGALGYGMMEAMQFGIARGFFVSGAGQAVFTVSHAPAKVKDPVEQAIFSITEIFLVTIICTVTALTILTSGVFDPKGNEAILVGQAFESTSPFLGAFVSIAIILFAYSTVIGLGYIGESQLNCIYPKAKSKIYLYVFLIFTFIGGAGGLKKIWSLTDFFLAIVMILNLAAMLLLSKKIFTISNNFWKNKVLKKEEANDV